MSLPLLSPRQANARVAEGAKLIDIRDADEYAREHIPAARSVPLDTLPGGLNAQAGETVIFHCQSGARTSGMPTALLRPPRPLRHLWSRGHSGLEAGGLLTVEDKSSRCR
jgi:rhodanese-related sulfurtransferase